MKINMKKIMPLLLVLLLAVLLFGNRLTPDGAAPGAVTVSEPAPTESLQQIEETPAATAGGEESLSLIGEEAPPAESPEETPEASTLDEDGAYTSAEDVALYLHTYGHLPGNFITKKEARELGWDGGSLERYAPGKCIGGDYFGNYEGLLPKAKGRSYHECDINTLGARSRGPERIIFSNDGLIYYTGDHYESFTLLYGEP